MSGYLQRIVIQAKGPAPDAGLGSGIRPLVRPLFSSPAAQALSEVHQEFKAVPTGLHHGEAQGMQATASGELRSASGSSARGDLLFTDASGFSMREPADGQGESERFAPLMSQSVMSQSVMPQSVLGAKPEHNEGLSERGESSNPVTTKVATETSSGFRVAEALRELMPLMPRQARVAALPSIAAVPASAPAVGDEIHINIGRIEVTAVPQTPAPRPAPRAPRRTFSLDDYLRKTDGRA